MSGMWKRSHAEPVRHRQTKGAVTDMFDLQPPRHISTLRLSPLAKGPLGGIVAEADAAIVEKAAKGGAALEHIIDRFGEHPRLTMST